MANQEESKRRIEALIQKGGQVLATSRKLSSKSSARILDASAFNDWKTQSLSFLMQLRFLCNFVERMTCTLPASRKRFTIDMSQT